MDENKLQKLIELNYKIKLTCGNCVHANPFVNDWSTCRLHSYNHKKHTEKERQLSINIHGWCSYHKLKALDETWKRFIEK